MSTSQFAIEVVGVQPGSIELECTPLDQAPKAVTRSFAFLVLRELDHLHGGGASWRTHTAALDRDQHDAEFFQAHLDALIERTEIQPAPDDAGERYRLRVVFAAGVRFAATLHARCETTAYDVWVDDPRNPQQPALRAQRTRLQAAALAARDRPSDDAATALERMLDALVANQLIELKPKDRNKLLAQLGKLDADDELTYVRKVIDTLSASKWVAELYGADEELAALLQPLVK